MIRINCREVARILHSGEVLSRFVKMRLALHVFFCRHCSALLKQMKIIRLKFRQLLERKTDIRQVEKVEKEVIEKLRKKFPE